MMYRYVIMRDNEPVGAMNADCGRTFHSAVMSDAMGLQNIDAVEPFQHGKRSYKAQVSDGRTVVYRVINVPVVR